MGSGHMIVNGVSREKARHKSRRSSRRTAQCVNKSRIVASRSRFPSKPRLDLEFDARGALEVVEDGEKVAGRGCRGGGTCA
jgi:hypothetical protein